MNKPHEIIEAILVERDRYWISKIKNAAKSFQHEESNPWSEEDDLVIRTVLAMEYLLIAKDRETKNR